MPYVHVAGKTSKTPGRRFLRYDPSIVDAKGQPGADLPSTWGPLYLKWQAEKKKVDAMQEAIEAQIRADDAKAGGTAPLQIFMRWEHISISLDDGTGRSSANNSPRVEPDQVPLGKLGDLLKWSPAKA